MKYQNGAWANKNAVRAYDRYVKLSTKEFKDRTARERRREFERLYKSK